MRTLPLSRPWRSACLSAAVALLAASPARTQTLYAIDQTAGNLYALSTSTAAASLIGSTGVPGLRSLELADDGFLYAFTATSASALYQINPGTGAATSVGMLGVGFVFEGGLALSPHGIAYGANSGSAANPGLFRIDLATGIATFIGVMTGGQHDLNGLAWRDDGKLIGLDRVTNAIVEVDPATAALMVVASCTASVGGVGGMAVQGARGYFATGGAALSGSNELWAFDPFTGAQSLIGPIGAPITGDGIAGLASDTRLGGSAATISLSTGGTQFLSLVSPLNSNNAYLLAGTTGGATPGFLLGTVQIPLNIDGPNGYFLYTVTFPNTFPLSNSFAVLDGGGQGQASVTVPAGAPLALAGIVLHHAFAVVNPGAGGPVTTVSNAVPLQLTF